MRAHTHTRTQNNFNLDAALVPNVDKSAIRCLYHHVDVDDARGWRNKQFCLQANGRDQVRNAGDGSEGPRNDPILAISTTFGQVRAEGSLACNAAIHGAAELSRAGAHHATPMY